MGGIGYLVAGVLFYGFVGWLLSIWLDADFWIPVGILVGAGFGMTWRLPGTASNRPRVSTTQHRALRPSTGQRLMTRQPNNAAR